MRESPTDETELAKLLSLSTERRIQDYRRIAGLSADLGRQASRDWDAKDEAELQALLAQYGSLREESLQTIGNRIQILLLGIAAVGALVGGSLTIDDPQASRKVIYAIFSGAIPLVCIFILFVWAGEAMRSSRVGYFLAADVEATINHKLGRFVLNWEANLWAGAQDRDEMWGPSMMAFVVIGLVAAAAPWCGVLFSGLGGVPPIGPILAILVPYLFLAAAALYLRGKLDRLRNNPVVRSVFFVPASPPDA
ncbi:MAG: hypothetical protein ABIP09_07915 [Gemmatimonadaceae bacterium]